MAHHDRLPLELADLVRGVRDDVCDAVTRYPIRVGPVSATVAPSPGQPKAVAA
jgi:hypothetical protein